MLTYHELRVLLVSGAVALAATLGSDLLAAASSTAAVSEHVLKAFAAA